MNAPAHPVIRIQAQALAQAQAYAAGSVQTASRCGRCLPSPTGPACSMQALEPCPPLQLIGPPAELERVLHALDSEMARVPSADGQAQPVSRSGLLHSLSLGSDETTLVLRVAPHCGGAQLAEAAFHILRRLMPDCDIYVTHRSA